MGKLDIGVGDDFPVDESAPPSPETLDAVRAARAECKGHREEWRRRREEWRAHRKAWRAEMRARRKAFKSDIKRSFEENFGTHAHPHHNPFLVRVAVILGILALAVALLPFLLMFGLVAFAAFEFFTGRRGRRGDSGHPNISQ